MVGWFLLLLVVAGGRKASKRRRSYFVNRESNGNNVEIYENNDRGTFKTEVTVQVGSFEQNVFLKWKIG